MMAASPQRMMAASPQLVVPRLRGVSHGIAFLIRSTSWGRHQ
jgi:hypothetical protein